MTSTVTRAQSNRTPSGCGGMGESWADAQLTRLQQLYDAMTSTRTKIFEECVENFVESLGQCVCERQSHEVGIMLDTVI